MTVNNTFLRSLSLSHKDYACIYLYFIAHREKLCRLNEVFTYIKVGYCGNIMPFGVVMLKNVFFTGYL